MNKILLTIKYGNITITREFKGIEGKSSYRQIETIFDNNDNILENTFMPNEIQWFEVEKFCSELKRKGYMECDNQC